MRGFRECAPHTAAATSSVKRRKWRDMSERAFVSLRLIAVFHQRTSIIGLYIGSGRSEKVGGGLGLGALSVFRIFMSLGILTVRSVYTL